MTPRAPGPISVRRFHLRHEVVATLLAALALLAGTWISADQLERRLIRLHQADLERVGQLLQEHLGDARRQLGAFAALPAAQRQGSIALLLPMFADVYVLNERMEVERVLLGSPSSRVFAGFSFATSPILPQLRQARGQGVRHSRLSRSHEDENPGVYLSGRDRSGALLLGRVSLSYLRAFMDRSRNGSGLPLLMVSNDGFVMLTSASADGVAALDLQRAVAGAASALQHRDALWQPVLAPDPGMGGHVVGLIPLEELAQQRRLVVLPSLATALLALVLFWRKNRRVDGLLFAPLTRFSEQIQAVERRVRQGLPESPRPVVATDGASGAPSRFQELRGLQRSFGELIDAIHARDRALREAHAREQRREEEQRRELRSKLRSSLLAATIAHEINLPLATIRLLCSQAQGQRQSDADSLDIEAVLASLSQQSLQVSSVIEKMRMLLRNVQTELVSLDPVPVLRGSRLAVKPLLRRFLVQLSCQGLEPAEPLLVEGDAVQLQMALTNLLRNAIEATIERPPAQRQVRLALWPGPKDLVIEVADSGPGFGFDPDDDTVDDTVLESSKPGGSGLGLFVVRTAVAHHHGRLRVDRCPQLGGARVRLELPRLRSASPLQRLPSPAAPFARGLPGGRERW
ncbi:MAG: ATP-binding protein [bacterium]